MESEYRVESGHLGYDDIALPKATKKYTSLLWPFDRRGRAMEKLEEKQSRILNKYEMEVGNSLGGRVTVTVQAEDQEEADAKMKKFKEDIEAFYRDEFGIEEPFEYSSRNGA